MRIFENGFPIQLNFSLTLLIGLTLAAAAAAMVWPPADWLRAMERVRCFQICEWKMSPGNENDIESLSGTGTGIVPPLLTLSRFSKFMSASSIGTVLVAGGGGNERRRRHVALLPTIRRSE